MPIGEASGGRLGVLIRLLVVDRFPIASVLLYVSISFRTGSRNEDALE
jgi:hypothetical protein